MFWDKLFLFSFIVNSKLYQSGPDWMTADAGTRDLCSGVLTCNTRHANNDSVRSFVAFETADGYFCPFVSAATALKYPPALELKQESMILLRR